MSRHSSKRFQPKSRKRDWHYVAYSVQVPNVSFDVFIEIFIVKNRQRNRMYSTGSWKLRGRACEWASKAQKHTFDPWLSDHTPCYNAQGQFGSSIETSSGWSLSKIPLGILCWCRNWRGGMLGGKLHSLYQKCWSNIGGPPYLRILHPQSHLPADQICPPMCAPNLEGLLSSAVLTSKETSE